VKRKRKYVSSGTVNKWQVTERTEAGNIWQSKTKQKFTNLNYPSAHALWTSGFTIYGDRTRSRDQMREDI
jgi:hypothetical protein